MFYNAFTVEQEAHIQDKLQAVMDELIKEANGNIVVIHYIHDYVEYYLSAVTKEHKHKLTMALAAIVKSGNYKLNPAVSTQEIIDHLPNEQLLDTILNATADEDYSTSVLEQIEDYNIREEMSLLTQIDKLKLNHKLHFVDVTKLKYDHLLVYPNNKSYEDKVTNERKRREEELSILLKLKGFQ
jgi:Mg/Co/Ni transporter MgtE